MSSPPGSLETGACNLIRSASLLVVPTFPQVTTKKVFSGGNGECIVRMAKSHSHTKRSFSSRIGSDWWRLFFSACNYHMLFSQLPPTLLQGGVQKGVAFTSSLQTLLQLLSLLWFNLLTYEDAQQGWAAALPSCMSSFLFRKRMLGRIRR